MIEDEEKPQEMEEPHDPNTAESLQMPSQLDFEQILPGAEEPNSIGIE